MLSELLDELIEDSPFLRQLHKDALAEGEAKGREEGREEGRVSGLRASVREIVRARFADISEEELADVDTLDDANRLQALIGALASTPGAGRCLELNQSGRMPLHTRDAVTKEQGETA